MRVLNSLHMTGSADPALYFSDIPYGEETVSPLPSRSSMNIEAGFSKSRGYPGSRETDELSTKS
jgi:hypothetical protein